MNRKSCNDLSDPTDYVMLMESDLNQRNAAGDHHALAPEPRHSGGDNYAFADGHAKWIRRDRAVPGKGQKPDILWKP
ncbi:MAG: hypothetical protein IT210_23110 [Armatimonadetes bacterium]|nr:hypothetical protein [Armatimonadota bacterium]